MSITCHSATHIHCRPHLHQIFPTFTTNHGLHIHYTTAAYVHSWFDRCCLITMGGHGIVEMPLVFSWVCGDGVLRCSRPHPAALVAYGFPLECFVGNEPFDLLSLFPYPPQQGHRYQILTSTSDSCSLHVQTSIKYLYRRDIHVATMSNFHQKE